MSVVPTGYRVLRVGEVISAGDYMQIGSPPHVSYQSVCTPLTCRYCRDGIDCGGVGHVIQHSGEIYWRSGD